MSHRIACYTLFDITRTGVLNRARPADDEKDIDSWILKRSTQSNFDTVLQAISLRSQPEIISNPEKILIKFDEEQRFGFLYTDNSENIYPCWTFDFEIQHPSVFEDGITELGYLYRDCHNIPMIKVGTEYSKVIGFLDTSPEFKNIYFVKY